METTKRRSSPVDIWELLKKTSRTFYLSIRILPREMDEALALAYLMLRVSDYLEDSETIPQDRKARLLHLWARVLDGEASAREFVRTIDSAGIDGGDDGSGHRDGNSDRDRDEGSEEVDRYAAVAADELLSRVSDLPDDLGDAILRHVRESTAGMERWVRRGPDIATEADMDDYMHEVAGRVGYLSTEVFAYYSPALQQRLGELMPLARETGLALQTVNVIRGVRDDYERGWVYIPRSYLRRAGLTPEELLDPSRRDDALAVLELLVQKAERHLDSAIEYVRRVPRRLRKVRLACIWPLLFAARTVSLSRGNPRVFSDGVKIARSEIKRIVFWSNLLGSSNLWVSFYTRKLLRA